MNAYLGIDVSKGYSDFLLLNDQHKQLTPAFQLDDTTQGHQVLIQWIDGILTEHGISQLYTAVESTGGFEDNWFACLGSLSRKLPVHISRLNPSVVKNAARAEMNIQVTDAQSARNIASYLIRYGDQVKYGGVDNQYREYRGLHNHIQLLTKQKTQLINELKQLLYCCFPELQRYCKKSIPNWVLSLLQQYPTAAKLARAKVTKVARIRSVTQARAEQLVERAKNSVASRGVFTDTYLVGSIAADIQHKQTRIDELKKLLCQNCQGSEVELLQTIKGIGNYSAASIMVQIEDISRFSSPKQLAGYFGLYPTIKESGDKRHVSRMSKKGRSAIRATLFMCANTAVIHDEHLKSIYARHRAKGKAHKQALGVVMHKMLRMIWGVLTSETAYSAAVDQQNTERTTHSTQDNEEKEIQQKRSLQSFDEDAPVSRLAFRKRKAHRKSQVSRAEHVRDLIDVPS